MFAYQHIPIFDWRDPAGANLVLYFTFAAALPTLFEIGTQIRGERLAGDLPYPMYICHAPVEMVVQALGLQERMSLPIWISANMLIVVLASALLLVATEPMEKFRLRFKSVGPRASSSAQLA